jgi:hypothetical protein
MENLFPAVSVTVLLVFPVKLAAPILEDGDGVLPGEDVVVRGGSDRNRNHTT